MLPWRVYLVLVIMKVPYASAHNKTIREADSNHDFLQNSKATNYFFKQMRTNAGNAFM